MHTQYTDTCKDSRWTDVLSREYQYLKWSGRTWGELRTPNWSLGPLKDKLGTEVGDRVARTSTTEVFLDGDFHWNESFTDNRMCLHRYGKGLLRDVDHDDISTHTLDPTLPSLSSLRRTVQRTRWIFVWVGNKGFGKCHLSPRPVCDTGPEINTRHEPLSTKILWLSQTFY